MKMSTTVEGVGVELGKEGGAGEKFEKDSVKKAGMGSRE